MIKYAKGPVSFLHLDLPDKNGKISRKKVKQLLWGDWVRVTGPDKKKGWLKVKNGKKTYLMREKDLQEERVLEIIFLDVGQGDGCILTEPGSHDDPRIIVVDAGVGSNMNGFLKWRFRDFPETGNIHAAIITHPDKDHYNGFASVFRNTNLKIDNVYHNGLVERTGTDLLGPVVNGYLTDIVEDHAGAKALLNKKKNRGRKLYPNMLKRAIDAKHIGEITALTTAHGTSEDSKTWMPGFAPADDGPVSIEVLGPVVEPDGADKPRLRAFGGNPTSTKMKNDKTKNGHSVLLRLEFNGFRVLFGGDLNTSSETFLMLWYGNDQTAPEPLSGDDPLIGKIADKAVIKAAKERLTVDLMKTCHHGSSDVTEEFLKATFATAFVISSGDNEGHVHPRPDLLGLLGKIGRGARPLLLSTELSRSTREREDEKLGPKLEKLSAGIEAEVAKGDDGDKDLLKTLRAERRKLREELLKRNVGVFGAINLRTDGKDAVVAFRKESASPSNRWFYYELTRDKKGVFSPVLKGH
jgi:beta-lactamase superfamily II metal-dependent hydrolase